MPNLRSPRLLIVVAVLFAAVHAPVRDARAGAWLQAPGASFTKLSWLRLSASHRFGCRGGTEAAEPFGGRYQENQAFLYTELGINRRITGLFSTGWKDARIVDAEIPEYGTRGTTDARVGARFGILTGSVPLSVETIVSIPTYPETDPRALVGAREQFLPAGSGQIEAEVRLLVGKSLYPLPLYVNLDLGRRERGGIFGDQWLAGFELGASGERWFAKSDLRGVFADGNLCGGASAGTVTLHEQNWRWSPEVAVRVAPEVWVGLGAAVLMSGRNTLDGNQWSLSVSWQRPGG